jgi:glucose repression regulatory protein TUP1
MNHYPPRVMGGGPPVGPAQRLNDLLDQIKTEFETESQRSVDYEGQSECLPAFIEAVAPGG